MRPAQGTDGLCHGYHTVLWGACNIPWHRKILYHCVATTTGNLRTFSLLETHSNTAEWNSIIVSNCSRGGRDCTWGVTCAYDDYMWWMAFLMYSISPQNFRFRRLEVPCCCGSSLCFPRVLAHVDTVTLIKVKQALGQRWRAVAFFSNPESFRPPATIACCSNLCISRFWRNPMYGTTYALLTRGMLDMSECHPFLSSILTGIFCAENLGTVLCNGYYVMAYSVVLQTSVCFIEAAWQVQRCIVQSTLGQSTPFQSKVLHWNIFLSSDQDTLLQSLQLSFVNYCAFFVEGWVLLHHRSYEECEDSTALIYLKWTRRFFSLFQVP